eukprot:m.194605 g.194605  ORF g.194605 m.194605 type:complete len:1707 (+) comp21792_c0_seq1:125-5245(+)
MDLRRHDSASWHLFGPGQRPMPASASAAFETVLAAGDVIQGNVHRDFPVPSTVLKMYLCSNDQDTDMETTAILEQIVPHMREVARARGVEVQVVALRWGVPHTLTVERLALNTCAARLKDCVATSCGLNFLALLTDKYGFRPLPPSIPVDEFVQLTDRIQMKEALALITSWYYRDDNMQPPEYVLQPLLDNYPNIFSKNQKAQAKDYLKWTKDLDVVQFALRNATVGLQLADPDKYTSSVIQQETKEGLLNPEKEDRGLAFLRHFTCKPTDLSARYGDKLPTGEVDDEAFALQEKLKDTVRGKLDEEYYFNYELDNKSKEQKKYLQRFREDFEKAMLRSVENAAESLKKFQEDPLILEILYHTRMCQEKTRHFQARTDILRRLQGYFQKRTRKLPQPLVLYGEAGAGRASTVARAAMSLSAASASVTVLRFIGISPDSANIRQVLFSICTQIVRAYRAELRETLSNIEKEIHAIHDEIARGDEEANEEVILHLKKLKWQYDFERVVHEDYESLILEFPYRLRLATARKPLYIFIESVDRLHNVYKPYDFDWLPKELPEHARIVVSTRAVEPNSCVMSLRERFPDDSCFMEIPGLSDSDTRKILDGWFAAINRTLTDAQASALSRCASTNGSVLYLQLCYLEAREWRSDTEDKTFLAATSLDLQGLLQHIATNLEKTHGKVLVSHALGYITASRFGLSEPELVDILSLDDEVLDEVFLLGMPAIRRLPQLYWARLRASLDILLVERGPGLMLHWNHAMVRDFFRARYLVGPRLKKTHALLAEYFGGMWSNKEKPFVLSSALVKQHKLKSPEGKANRFVPSQPFKFTQGGKTLVNRRKLEELAFHLVRAGDGHGFVYQCLSNFDWLALKVKTSSVHDLLDEIHEAMADPNCELIADVTNIVHTIINLSARVVSQDNGRFASQLLGRILPSASLPTCLQNLVIQARLLAFEDNVGLVPMRTCLLGPGCGMQKLFRPFSHDIPWLGFTNRGNRLAAFLRTSSDPVYGEDILRLYDVDTGFELQNFNLVTTAVQAAEEAAGEDGEVPVARVVGTAWTSMGMLVTTHSDGTMCVWDVEDKERIFEGSLGRRVSVFACSRDGTLVVFPNSIVASVYDAEQGKVLGSLQGHTRNVTAVGLSRDQTLAITGSADLTVGVHSMESYKLLFSLGKHDHDSKRICGEQCVGHRQELVCVRLAADNSTAVTACGQEVIVWQTKTQSILYQLPHTGSDNIVFSAEGNLFATSALGQNANYALHIHELEGGKLVRSFWGHADKITSISFAPDGTVLTGSKDGTIRQWTLRGTSSRGEAGADDSAPPPGIRLHGPPDGFAAAHTTALALVCSSHGQVCLAVSLEKGLVVAQLEAPPDAGQLVQNGVALAPSGQVAACVYSMGMAVVWDPTNGKTRHLIKSLPSYAVGPALSASRGLLVGGGKEVQLYSVETGQPTTKISVRLSVEEKLQRVQVPPADNMVLLAFTTQLTTCTLDGIVLKQLSYNKDDPVTFALPVGNGHHVVSCSEQSQKVILWAANPTGEEFDLDGPKPTVCCASVDGKFAAGGFQQGLLKIWDIAVQEEMFSEFVHEDTIICLHLREIGDTLWLASGSEDWTVRTWKLQKGAREWVAYQTFHSDAPVLHVHIGEISLVYGCANGAIGVLVLAPQSIEDIVLPSLAPLQEEAMQNKSPSKPSSRRASKTLNREASSSSSVPGKRKESCSLM